MNLKNLTTSHRSCFILSLLITFIFISSCATARHEPYPKATYAVASWYGSDFHGRPTASGELYDMYGLTCAHREYAFGTQLKVTNILNDRSVNCLVNDRGPFVEGRDIDLSYAAAREIGLTGPGTGRVRIEYMGRDITYQREVGDFAQKGPFTVQVGSFRDISNATRLKMALELKYSQVYITKADIDGSSYYRVRIGKFNVKNDAFRFAKTLADEGYNIFITTYDEKVAI